MFEQLNDNKIFLKNFFIYLTITIYYDILS